MTILPSIRPPFFEEYELNKDLNGVEPSKVSIQCLPGYPRLRLQNTTQVQRFLSKEFDLKDLEEIAPKLWTMSTQSSKNISPLHRQKVKRRNIIVTEDPRMHLIWHYDRIFIKPLPEYLLSYNFWQQYLLNPSPNFPDDKVRVMVRKAALGYLRTYTYLIRYESDFRIATSIDLSLVPPRVTWQEFCDFSSSFEDIPDSEVAERYSYGEIRLSRLNFYAKFFMRKSNFQRVNAQYGQYFAQFYGPLLFVFGILSVLLSAMQVEMAVEALTTDNQWTGFWQTCRWGSMICILALIVTMFWLLGLFVYKVGKEWWYALGQRRRRKRDSRVAYT